MLDRRNCRTAETVWRVRTIRGIQANQNMEDINEKRGNNPFCSKTECLSLGMHLSNTLGCAVCISRCRYLSLLLMTPILVTNKSTDSSSWLQLDLKTPASRSFFFFCKVKICQHYGEGLRTEIIGKEAACFLQECSTLLSGEQGVSVISKSKPNKVNQPNLFQGHSGFPQAIKMFKPLNISDLFSCIPHLQLTCTLKVRWNHYLILILPKRLHLQAL